MATQFQCQLEGRTTLEGRPGEFSPAEIESAYFGIAGARAKAPAAESESR
jgi:hypothetical protein